MSIPNITVDTNLVTPTMYIEGAEKIVYVEKTVHAISIPEIAIAAIGFGVLVYFWIKVNKDKEKYKHWINPKGREVNVYKILKIMMYVYPLVVVIMGLLQIYLMNMRLS